MRGFVLVVVVIWKWCVDGCCFGIWYRKVVLKMIVYLICVVVSGFVGCVG